MKLHAIMASAVTLALAFSSPAEAFNKTDSDFVNLESIAFVVAMKCDKYDFIDGGAQQAADQVGADFDTLAPAIQAAIQVTFGLEYDRTKLIPAVTQRVRTNLEVLLDELKKGNGFFCQKYGTTMINVGFMKKK
jgi:hypothetical protein